MKKGVIVLTGIILFINLLFSFNTAIGIDIYNNTDPKYVTDELNTQEITTALSKENSETTVQVKTNYSLDLVLDPSTHSISGNMILEYINTENIGLDVLYFHLYPNASENEDIPGYILINSVKTADTLQNLPYSFGIQLLNVTLPQAIAPQETVSIRIEFHTYITNNQSYRLTYGDEPEKGLVYALCTYYPILAVYDNTGWNLEPQYFVGDPYYSDLANYYVNLTVPTEYVVASSGQVITQMDLNSKQKYVFKLLKARDFSFAVSPNFIVETGSFGEIDICIYYLPFVSVNWTDVALDYVLYSLELFTDLYGAYPYPTFSVASTYGFYGGMEWPGLVYIQAGFRWVETAIVHEVCHQWFYAVVGNDQIDEGFLDEGIVCYNHWYYFEHRYNWNGFFEEHLWRTATTSNSTAFPEGLVINRSINDIVERNLDPQYYWESAYHKAPAVYHLLRTYVGDEVFFSAIRRYYTLFKFQTATFKDLIDCFHYYTNIFDWFLPWFNEGFIPEIEIVQIHIREASVDNGSRFYLTVTIQQVGPSIYYTEMPLLISFSERSDLEFWIYSNKSSPTSLMASLVAKPTDVSLALTSGYLYSINLLLMDDLTYELTTISTRTPGFLLTLSVFVLMGLYLKKRMLGRN
jgi:hypothetical protein